jgi:hypothetical protein
MLQPFYGICQSAEFLRVLASLYNNTLVCQDDDDVRSHTLANGI